MKAKVNSLTQMQAERKTRSLQKFSKEAVVKPGWIAYMRHVLGMTLRDLSTRAGISVSSTAQAERREKSGQVTIETLRKMADAMNCDFVYAFVPRESISSHLQKQALQKARMLLRRADTHMTLEDQKVKESFEQRAQRLANKLLESGDVW